MFHSQSLLSRKGPLGLLWIAASCHRRLKKTQVAGVDLLSYIGKILLDDFPLVSSRILGTLLLGVSRIFSMQVGYLLDDCHTTLNEIGQFVKKKAIRKQVNALILPSDSIVVPERFELDSFDLDSDYVERDNVMRLSQHIMDGDDWVNDIIGSHSLVKIDDAAVDVFSTISRTYDECIFPPLPECPLKNTEYSIPSFTDLREKLSPKDDISADMFLGVDEELLELITKSTQNVFNYDWHMNQTDEIKTDELHTLVVMRNEFNDVCDENSTKLVPDDGELDNCSAKVLTRIEECTESSEVLKNGAGVSDFLTVATPTKKENTRNRQKRKCRIDDVIVLPNKFIKQSLEDATDLVCKRRKAPHTALDSWRALHISNLYDASSSPLLPFCFVDSLPPKWEDPPEFIRNKDENMGADGVALFPINTPPLVVPGVLKPGSPTTDKISDMPLIAPNTPVDFPSLRRFQNGIKSLYREESTSSSECMCKGRLINNQDIDLNLIEEHTDGDEGTTHEVGIWSWRTRRLAKYLQKSFDSQREKANESVMSLFHVLEGKGRKDGARIFYEILVLKTEGCLDVVQDDAYGEILLLPMKT